MKIFLFVFLLSCAREPGPAPTEINVSCPESGLSEKDFLDLKSENIALKKEIKKCTEDLNILKIDSDKMKIDKEYIEHRFTAECITYDD